MEFKRRGMIEIVYLILECCTNGAPKTRIAYNAHINFKTCMKYLDMLVERGVLEEVQVDNKRLYRITPKGEQLLNYLRHVIKLLGIKLST